MGFAENLRDELDYQGMQVKELAEKTGLSINTLNKYRPGSTVVPTIDNAQKIARALNVSLDYLATGAERQSDAAPALQRIMQQMHRFSERDMQAVAAVVSVISEKYE